MDVRLDGHQVPFETSSTEDTVAIVMKGVKVRRRARPPVEGRNPEGVTATAISIGNSLPSGPPIGMMMGGVNFENLFHPLSDETFATLAEAQKAGAATINYGVFFNAILDFLIVAFVIFLVIQQMNKLKRKEEAPPPAPTTKDCPQCLSAIPIKASRCAHCTAPLEA